MSKRTVGLSRRTFVKSAIASSTALAASGGVSLFNISRGFAANLPDPASVLAKINVGNYVKKDYRELYKLADDEQLWDPAKDWIRTVDWEQVRKEFAGKTVKFAIGAGSMWVLGSKRDGNSDGAGGDGRSAGRSAQAARQSSGRASGQRRAGTAAPPRR